MQRITEFTLTQTHIDLIKRMYVQWDDGAYDGAPAINLKRPYGNSDVVGDVYEVVHGHYFDRDGEDVPTDLSERMLAIHRETETALQIILCTGSFVPGLYMKQEEYDSLSWKLV